jgi:hypothetical protein
VPHLVFGGYECAFLEFGYLVVYPAFDVPVDACLVLGAAGGGEQLAAFCGDVADFLAAEAFDVLDSQFRFSPPFANTVTVRTLISRLNVKTVACTGPAVRPGPYFASATA